MTVPSRKIDWISPPPETCCLCREPMTRPDDASAWNGRPAHRECVRIHLLQTDAAFREGGSPDELPGDPPEGGEGPDGVLPTDDEDSDFG